MLLLVAATVLAAAPTPPAVVFTDVTQGRSDGAFTISGNLAGFAADSAGRYAILATGEVDVEYVWALQAAKPGPFEIREGSMLWIDETGVVHEDCVTFLKASDEFGELSNMCGEFPLLGNEVRVESSEALYQACRFPHQPDWQREILDQKSPMSAKLKAKKDGRRKNHSRPDWDSIHRDVMWWVLCVKYAQHWRRIGHANQKLIVDCVQIALAWFA